MSVLVVAERELHAKIVYYGPGLSGKTTNISWLYEHLPVSQRSKLVSIDTGDERTLFFDCLPLECSQIGDYRLRLHLYTVPGQDQFAPTRRAVLHGVDGIIFVADAQQDRVVENQRSLLELDQHMVRQGRRLADLALVMQYNKSDLPGALTRAQLDAYHNPRGVPSVTASALHGQGIVESLTIAIREVVRRL